MKAAIYCRVSTESQEQEGTSLQTQLEACKKYCQVKGYEVAFQFSEAWSGLSLERPKLAELREVVRSKSIKKSEVIAYEELGAEAILRLEVEDFPATVINDIYGGDLFQQGKAKYAIAQG